MKIFELFEDAIDPTQDGSVYLQKLQSTTLDYLVSLFANGPEEVLAKQVLVFLKNLGHDVTIETLPELLDNTEFVLNGDKIQKAQDDMMPPDVGMPGTEQGQEQPSFADQKISNMARNEINRGMND